MRFAFAGLIIAFAFAPAAAGGAGQEETIRASGAVMIEQGAYYSGDSVEGSGQIVVTTVDVGARVSPLKPHDDVHIEATIETGDEIFDVRVDQPLVSDPAGRFTTWWGAGYHVAHHGDSGIGTDKLSTIDSDLAALGLGDVLLDGEVIAANVPVHVMTAEDGLPGELELDVGDPDLSPVPGLPDGHLRVVWSDYEGDVSYAPERLRWLGGGGVLVVIVGGLLALNARRLPAPPNE